MSLSCYFLHSQVLQIFCHNTDGEQCLEIKGGEGILGPLYVSLLLCSARLLVVDIYIEYKLGYSQQCIMKRIMIKANPCQKFLLLACLILIIYKETELILFIYKKIVV